MRFNSVLEFKVSRKLKKHFLLCFLINGLSYLLLNPFLVISLSVRRMGGWGGSCGISGVESTLNLISGRCQVGR